MSNASITIISGIEHRAIWELIVTPYDLSGLYGIPEDFSLCDSHGEVSSCRGGGCNELQILHPSTEVLKLRFTTAATIKRVGVYRDNNLYFSTELTFKAPVKTRLLSVKIDNDTHTMDIVVKGDCTLRMVGARMKVDDRDVVLKSELSQVSGVISSTTGERFNTGGSS